MANKYDVIVRENKIKNLKQQISTLEQRQKAANSQISNLKNETFQSANAINLLQDRKKTYMVDQAYFQNKITEAQKEKDKSVQAYTDMQVAMMLQSKEYDKAVVALKSVQEMS